MLSRLTNFFTHKQERDAINALLLNQQILTSNIVALARLLLIHGDTLKRESDNIPANTRFMQEYAK